MSDMENRTLARVMGETFSIAVAHWAQLTIGVGLLATGFGFFTLYIYTKIIGRTDLFMPSIDVKSALAVWLLLIIPLIICYILMLSVTTWLFGCAVSLFSGIKKHQGLVTIYLCIPTLLGFASFIIMIFYTPSYMSGPLSLLILTAMTLPVYYLLYAITPFGRLVRKNQALETRKAREVIKLRTASKTARDSHPVRNIKSKTVSKTKTYSFYKRVKHFQLPPIIHSLGHALSSLTTRIKNLFYGKGAKPRFRRRIVFVTCSWGIILLTVGCAAFPTMLTLRGYLGAETQEATRYVASLAMFTLALTLIPVFIFYLLRGDLYKRARNGLIALLFTFAIFATTSDGALGQITYVAAGGLDIRHKNIERYVLSEDFGLSDLNSTIWKTRSLPSKKIEIEAYQLFSFGDVLLLCPKDMLSLDYKNIRKYALYCISTHNSKVTQKPKQPNYARPDTCSTNTICKAGRWTGWQNLRTSMTKAHK